MYTEKDLINLKSFYANQLLNDTIPFNMIKCVDFV